MKIRNIDDLSSDQIEYELRNGARFVVFQYCISILIMTFKRGSDVYFVRSNQGTFFLSLPYTILTLILGWWGIPWGPIYTIGAVFKNLSGGIDVTADIQTAYSNQVASSVGVERVPGR